MASLAGNALCFRVTWSVINKGENKRAGLPLEWHVNYSYLWNTESETGYEKAPFIKGKCYVVDLSCHEFGGGSLQKDDPFPAPTQSNCCPP